MIASNARSLRIRVLVGSCGSDCFFGGPVIVSGADNIAIGSRFRSMGSLYLYADDGTLVIGDNCSINTNVQLGAAQGEIAIGDNVLIGPNVVLRAADHDLDLSEDMQTVTHARGTIRVGDGAWIGANSVVTRNVSIGAGSVVAAGAVVTGDVDPYTIVGGVPARVISSRR
jgi:galactoside O-acetyltransferase